MKTRNLYTPPFGVGASIHVAVSAITKLGKLFAGR